MSGSVITFYRKIHRSGPLAVFFLAAILLGTLIPSYGQTVFNCSSFNSGNGTCGSSGPFKVIGNHGSITGSNQLQLAPAGTPHTSLAANYTTPVNVQAFTATYTFVPSGNVLAFFCRTPTINPGIKALHLLLVRVVKADSSKLRTSV